ncbi:hypothetical protein BGZ67_006786 [Mortierella alpina]|nr:hypothetical protein BGZ67_006786 [Mortierella alpina]
MGNVSSADHDRVNELLSRRVRRKNLDRSKKQQQQQELLQQQQQQQQQQQLHQRSSTGNQSDAYLANQSYYSNSSSSYSNSGAGAGQGMQRQKSSSRYPLHPLDQADFYGTTSNRTSDLYPQSPASPSFSIPSSATTPTSASYQSDTPYLNSRFEDRMVENVGPGSPASPNPASLQHQPTPRQNSTPNAHQYHSSPIVIPQQHRYSHASGNSVDDLHLARSPALPAYIPSRRGSEHHILHLQQQQQLSADTQFLGTSPEAKDWLKQKPTRSSTHMIHQYNFHSSQYYQQPGSIAVKVVNNTCRNMSDYANVPSLSSLGGRSIGANPNQSPTTQKTMSSRSNASKSATVMINPNSNSTGTAGDSNNGNIGPRPSYASAPIPSSRSRGLSQPEPAIRAGISSSSSTSSGHQGQAVNLGSPPQKPLPQEPYVGKLVMSRSKLVSPLITAAPSKAGTQSSGSSPLSSPLEQRSPGIQSFFGAGIDDLTSYAGMRQQRPSSTLSSLRSLLGNHPQGLSLIDALEEDEDDDLESLSDTETGDSEADLVQRTQSLTASDNLSSTTDSNGNKDKGAVSLSHEKRSARKRPPPQFDWMAARRRFSASSLSTISRDIHDSQKGQHALWKYIGGGNSHAPLRYDIDRILDSGCGLGEWTMEMAKEFPNATVYGIDINPELFPSAHQAVPSNCLFTQSNLLTRLSFPNQYFDFVYQRFLYLGLTVDDWPVALKELRRVLKPGGWIELFEPCMRVHRAGVRTREMMRWCSRLLQEERGLDFDFAGEKMKALCESDEIGFQNVKLERLSIPVGSWGGRVGQAMAENMVLIFQNLQSALMPDDTQTPNGAAQKTFDKMVQGWIRECEDNKSYIDYYILVAQRAV